MSLHIVKDITKITLTAVPFLILAVACNRVLSLINSYRDMSHKVIPVSSLASIISRQAEGERGKASW